MLTLTDEPDAGFETTSKTGLAEYNESKAHRRDWRALAVTVTGPETGKPAGGLLGTDVSGPVLFGPVLSAGAFARLGRRERGSAHGGGGGRAPGMSRGDAGTVNFQAPEFYARHGWEEFGRIQTAPDVARIFMRKTLAGRSMVAPAATGRCADPEEPGCCRACPTRAVFARRGGDSSRLRGAAGPSRFRDKVRRQLRDPGWSRI